MSLSSAVGIRTWFPIWPAGMDGHWSTPWKHSSPYDSLSFKMSQVWCRVFTLSAPAAVAGGGGSTCKGAQRVWNTNLLKMFKIVIQFRDSYDFCPTREWKPNGRVAGFAIGRKKIFRRRGRRVTNTMYAYGLVKNSSTPAFYQWGFGTAYIINARYCNDRRRDISLRRWCRHEVLALSEGIDVDSHALKWDLVLCLLFAWIFVFFCTIGGVKSVGKVTTPRAFASCSVIYYVLKQWFDHCLKTSFYRCIMLSSMKW